MCLFGGVGASHPQNFEIARKLAKNSAMPARELATVFHNFFLVTVVGQMDNTPPSQQKVSRHISDLSKDSTVGFSLTNRKKVFRSWKINKY